VIVEAVNKIFFFMANPASSQRRFGDAGTHFFKEGQRSVQGIIMTLFAARIVFRIFFWDALIVQFTMNAFSQERLDIFVSEFFFS
jgi:hypothetical protein